MSDTTIQIAGFILFMAICATAIFGNKSNWLINKQGGIYFEDN